MTYYYSHQARRWLTEDEQSRMHLDYDPQPTEASALVCCRAFLHGRLRDQIKWLESWTDTLDRLPVC